MRAKEVLRIMAQRRRKSIQDKRKKAKERTSILLCTIAAVGVVVLSLVICLIVFDYKPAVQTGASAASTPLPFDVNTPFSISDLTASQLTQIRQQGRLHVSDGPRGISIGDSLDKIIERYPSGLTVKQDNSEQTGMQSDEEIILYCADYFENQNGVMTALPPRGLLTVDNGSIIVTLLAPTSAYPVGTKDSYGSYEHIYCLYTIDPDSSTVSEIVLGIDR